MIQTPRVSIETVAQNSFVTQDPESTDNTDRSRPIHNNSQLNKTLQNWTTNWDRPILLDRHYIHKNYAKWPIQILLFTCRSQQKLH